MSLTVATHSGPFHADDVVALALLQTFVDPLLVVIRTRDADQIKAADVVVDVGAIYDPATQRFDHHQHSYTGSLSSAGMVLEWLGAERRIRASLQEHLQREAFDYLDAVDNGRIAPTQGVPCFPRMVDALNQLADGPEGFDTAFGQATAIARVWLQGMVAEHDKVQAARAAVRAAMERAEAAGSNLLVLEEYLRWKPAYFELGGESHCTELALFPGTDGSYRVLGIPPSLGDFGQKRPLPEAWAGLTDDELSAVVGVPGAVFCHKNRFIAVFDSKEHCLQALQEWDLVVGPLP